MDTPEDEEIQSDLSALWADAEIADEIENLRWLINDESDEENT